MISLIYIWFISMLNVGTYTIHGGCLGPNDAKGFHAASNEARQDKVRFPSVNCALPHPVTGMTLGE